MTISEYIQKKYDNLNNEKHLKIIKEWVNKHPETIEISDRRNKAHIKGVAYLGKILGKDFSNHDHDKLDDEKKKLPYILISMYYNPDYKDIIKKEVPKETIDYFMEDIINLHFCSQKHHVDYWKLINKPMSEEAMLEFCSDLTAIGLEVGNSPQVYFKENNKKGKKFDFNEKQVEFILNTMEKLWPFGQDEITEIKHKHRYFKVEIYEQLLKEVEKIRKQKALNEGFYLTEDYLIESRKIKLQDRKMEEAENISFKDFAYNSVNVNMKYENNFFSWKKIPALIDKYVSCKETVISFARCLHIFLFHRHGKDNTPKIEDFENILMNPHIVEEQDNKGYKNSKRYALYTHVDQDEYWKIIIQDNGKFLEVITAFKVFKRKSELKLESANNVDVLFEAYESIYGFYNLSNPTSVYEGNNYLEVEFLGEDVNIIESYARNIVNDISLDFGINIEVNTDKGRIKLF